ncbi:MAG: hypothetical protein HON55_01545, partial [Legionellales bacterium]|nr:hypothetical protein [Legionellales bacterium]
RNAATSQSSHPGCCFPLVILHLIPSLRGAQRRRNLFVVLPAASPFNDPDQKQCLEQGAEMIVTI